MPELYPEAADRWLEGATDTDLADEVESVRRMIKQTSDELADHIEQLTKIDREVMRRIGLRP